MRLEEIFGKVWVHKDMTSSPRCQTWGGCGVRGCVYLKASAPIRAILQLLCAFPLCELPLRQSWDRLQRCDRAEMPNDTGRLSQTLSPHYLSKGSGECTRRNYYPPTNGETNAQTLEAKCQESHRELRQPTGHPSSSAGFLHPGLPGGCAA